VLQQFLTIQRYNGVGRLGSLMREDLGSGAGHYPESCPLQLSGQSEHGRRLATAANQGYDLTWLNSQRP
jgi:hypothetical protein